MPSCYTAQKRDAGVSIREQCASEPCISQQTSLVRALLSRAPRTSSSRSVHRSRQRLSLRHREAGKARDARWTLLGVLAVGLVLRDAKPHILVAPRASRAAGMDLDPELLQLSEVVR